MRVRAVLFDLGDTIWRATVADGYRELVERRSGPRMASALREMGKPVPSKIGLMVHVVTDAIWSAEDKAYHSTLRSPDGIQVFRDVAGDFGLELTREEAAALREAYNLPNSIVGRTIFDDTIDTLHHLQKQGFRQGILSNRPFGSPSLERDLEELGVLPYFEHVITSCDFGWMKPHRRIYEHALALFDVPPAEAVMIGDSLHADVAGAQAVGLKAIWKRREPNVKGFVQDPGSEARPDAVIDHLCELCDLLEPIE